MMLYLLTSGEPDGERGQPFLISTQSLPQTRGEFYRRLGAVDGEKRKDHPQIAQMTQMG